VRLQVASLSRSLAFYETVLGLRVLRREGSRVTLGPTGGDTVLIELSERPEAPPAKGRLGLYHFAILLPDRAALGRFLNHLLALGVRAGSADHLVSEALYLHDPDGLGIEVYADRPREQWQVDAGELVMDTLPLDGHGLSEAARGEPWQGMPAGTRMGHIHLHVGSLDRADAFYHLALGFDIMVRRYPGALFLAAGGYHHHLGVNTWAGPAAEPPADREARLLEWELVLPTVEDVRNAALSLERAGFPARAQGESRLVLDPWGVSLRLLPDQP